MNRMRLKHKKIMLSNKRIYKNGKDKIYRTVKPKS